MIRKEIKSKKPPVTLEVKENTELMLFLIAGLPHKNRNNIKTLMKDKHITVNGEVQTHAKHPLKTGQKVEVHWVAVPQAKQFHDITLIHEDDHIIVIDKHSGVLSVATDKEKRDTAYSILSSHVKQTQFDSKIFIVHRLDKDTSGLMVYAKTQKAKDILQKNWNTAVQERSYLAIVEGKVAKDEGIIKSYLKETSALMVYSSQNPAHGSLSITHYKVLRRAARYTMLKVDLETGRKNQVRVHMNDLGHPVIGDKKYGAKTDPIDRLGLHAYILAFTHPITGENMRFETPAPRKFTRLFK
jgi:23S rRNA pseudouridine1911/1915/1917 synthase